MSCCNTPFDCQRSSYCSKRAQAAVGWSFPDCPIKPDTPPHSDLASDAFYFIGFIFFVAVICGVAGLAWGLLVRFAPGFVHMLQYVFS